MSGRSKEAEAFYESARAKVELSTELEDAIDSLRIAAHAVPGIFGGNSFGDQHLSPRKEFK